jgi:hypothetical protein
VYEVLADAVVVVHFAFLVFIAVGGLLAWRWPSVLYAHVPAVAWSVGIISIGYECPLTPLEKRFRELAGGEAYRGGFIDRYVEGVIYPERYTTVLRALMAAAVVVGWVGFAHRHRKATRAAVRNAREREIP